MASEKLVTKIVQMSFGFDLNPFQQMLHDWSNKGRGMCYHVCGMLHIEKTSPCSGSGFPLSLSEWSFTICQTP